MNSRDQRRHLPLSNSHALVGERRHVATRRQFLAQATSACAAASLVSLPYSRAADSPNDRVLLGLIGAGPAGLKLAKAASRIAGCAFVAVCDVDERRRDKAAGEMAPGVERYGDLRQMCEARNLDAVVVATPSHWNALATVWACQTGKDVYLEPPLTHNIGEVSHLIRSAQKYRRVVQTGHPLRSHEQMLSLMDRFKSLGEMKLVRISYQPIRPALALAEPTPVPAGLDWDQWLGPAPTRRYNPVFCHTSWRQFWDFGAGYMGDGVGLLDLAHLWMPPSGSNLLRVKAGGGHLINDAAETPDTQSLEFESGARRVVYEHRAWRQAGGEAPLYEVECYGTRGSLRLTDKGWAAAGQQGSLAGLDDPTFHVGNFLDCVRSRKTPAAELAATSPATLWLHAGNIAWRLCSEERPVTTVDLDMASRQFSQAEANRFLDRQTRPGFAWPG